MSQKVKCWIEAMRLRTLPVSIAGVVMAVSLAASEGRFRWLPAVLCFLFAVLAQVASNFANEYYDFKKGSDRKGRVGPRRGVTEGDITPGAMKLATYGVLAAACAVGCCLVPIGGLWLLPVGIVIALFALAYSTGPYPLSYHGLGEVTVFCFFGLIPVNLTYYLQTGEFTYPAFALSAALGMMGANVLIVNNYRDMDDDLLSGKRTIVVLWGRKFAATLYLLLGVGAIAVLFPFLYSWSSALHLYGVWIAALIYLGLHVQNWQKMKTSIGGALNPLLGATARAMLVFTVLLSVALFCGR